MGQSCSAQKKDWETKVSLSTCSSDKARNRLDASPPPETETKDTIHAEVKEKVESILDQESLEDRMKLSLLSNAL